jgi:hypothetical protein
MNATQCRTDLTAAVKDLLNKYGRSAAAGVAEWEVVAGLPAQRRPNSLTLLPGWSLEGTEADPSFLPLLPWRSERRFVELKRTVDDRTIEPLSMCRFSCATDGRLLDLSAMLYRELDLAEWLSGSKVTALTATIEAGRWANVIVRLANGVVCGLELTASLPEGSMMIDRHELIAGRGVACDRVVDSQVPQSSIYAFTANGEQRYTDTDAELFGMSVEEVTLVRSAYETIGQAEQFEALRRQHRHLVALVRLALESDRLRRRMAVEGDL